MRLLRLVLFSCWALAAAAGDRPFTPDHAQANIDGKQAMMSLPMADGRIGDLKDCRVVLAPGDAMEKRIYHPCGEWYLPPEPGGYLNWIETKTAASSPQTVLIYRAAPYDGGGLLSGHELVPSGSVAVKNTVPAGGTVRYLHLDQPGRGFQLRVAAAEAGKPSLMPAGRVIAGIFNAADESVAHSKPMVVEAGKLTVFDVRPPATGSDLMVVLEKPRRERKTSYELTANGRDPDVVHDQGYRLIGFWFGLEPGLAQVKATSPDSAFSKAVTLSRGSATTIRATIPEPKETPKGASDE